MIYKVMMRSITIIFISFIVLSCAKTNEPDVNQGEIDNGKIEKYVLDNQLDGQFTSSGLYYVIEQPGGADHPNLYSTVTCTYKGYSLNNVVFDEGEFISFPLNKVILGWQEGIPLIGEGGKIKLVIPSALAYGSNGSGSAIQPNEVLVFDVTLHYFSK